MPLRSDRLKQARCARGLTQQDLADKFKVTQQRVAKWENGFTNLTAETLVPLADFLDCTTDWLLGLVNDPQAKVSEAMLSLDEQTLIELYRAGALPPDIQRLITQNAGVNAQEHLVINSINQPSVASQDETLDGEMI